MKGATYEKYIAYLNLIRISIHAPMKGATTLACVCCVVYDDISIHAPMKGATYWCKLYNKRYKDFNPRTHEGCDLRLMSALESIETISIHAPMKGATLSRFAKGDVNDEFQSTHP